MFADSATINYRGPEVGMHSSLMDGVVDAFKPFLEKVDFKDLKIPLLSCIDGDVVTMGPDTKERFIRHINSPLEWSRVMRLLADYDCIIIATPAMICVIGLKQQYPGKSGCIDCKKSRY